MNIAPKLQNGQVDLVTLAQQIKSRREAYAKMVAPRKVRRDERRSINRLIALYNKTIGSTAFKNI